MPQQNRGPPRDLIEPVFDDRSCCFCGHKIPQAHHARRRRIDRLVYYFHPACPPRFKALKPINALS